VLTLAGLLLAGVPAMRAAAQAGPCAGCVAIVVDPAAAGSLPSSLSGLDVLVRVGSATSQSSPPSLKLQRAGAPELEVIRHRGGRPGVLLAVDGADLPADRLAFDIKTQLTAIRARLPRDVTIALEGSRGALEALLARDAGAYADVVVSAERPRGALRWWQLAGVLTGASARHTLAGGAERSLWRLPDDAAEAAQAVSALLHALGEDVDVRAARPLRIEEIIARHQAVAASQRTTIQTQIATGTMTLAFEAPAFPAPVTITADTIIYKAPDRTDVEQRAVKVNGLDVGNGVPRLPLLEPERVASPPLAIELSGAYRYALHGIETIAGTPCYVVGFEPLRGGASLFRGRAWIAVDDFGLVKVSAVQTNLRGPIVMSEQTDEFSQSSTGVWLLRRSRVNQVYEGAAHRTPIERVVSLTRQELNPPDFEARRRAAYASRHIMLRDTPQGYRYLARGSAGSSESASEAVERQVVKAAERVRTIVAGAIVDPNISNPLPFAGISYVDFDLFGTGTQFNGFYGGTFGQLAFSVPSLKGTRWQVAGRAFGIASAYNDRSFGDGRERYEENVRQRPAHASVWLVRPLSSRVSIRGGYELDYTHYDRADTTGATFTVPSAQVAHALRLSLDVHQAGWNASAWWSPAVRSGWQPWGWASGDDYDARHQDFQRYGFSLGRSTVLTPRLVAHVDASWMSGHDLDRFSRFAFGAFDNRLRGYPSALIRYDRGAVVRHAVAWSAGRRLRLDGFADAAFVEDPGFGKGFRPFTGIGAAAETPAPFGTLIAGEWGYGVQGRNADGGRGTHVVRVSFYRIF
jgi:hypothetical protein